MIKICKPFIEVNNDRARCVCEIIINGESKKVWFEVDEKYKEYLSVDRADAYVIGLLNFAMRSKNDIMCEVPVTDELLHNLNEILVPTLSKYSRDLYKTTIIAEVIEPSERGNHVGTGCSCGIDSFYSINMHHNSKYPSMELTDLCINNVGAFNECYEKYGKEKTKEERYKVTKDVAKELNLNLIETDSNFFDEIYQNHHLSHTYSSCFAIYMLQKYWKIYYYASSGYDFSHFNLKNNSQFDCSDYELLSLQCFSTSSIRIYSDGGEKQRIEKTSSIVDYDLAQKYLHVCIAKSTNCGVCPKCRRTLVSLDYLNKLNNFKDVFDVEYYKNNKKDYYKWLYKQHKKNDLMNEPVYQGLKNRKEFVNSVRFYRVYYSIFVLIKNFIPKRLLELIKERIKSV